MDFIVSDDPARLDRERVYAWVSSSYWAVGIPRETMDRAVDASLCFGAYRDDGRQIGFARVITDRATFAYLCDVVVDPESRGAGVGRGLIEAIHAHPALLGLRRWMLATRDAHGLYAEFGWTGIPDPSILMQRHDPDIYIRSSDAE